MTAADIQALASEVAVMDWEHRDSDTQYLTHGIHRYSGKFIPQIAQQAIGLLTEPEAVVLDPYMGSGTTLLESAIMGRHSIGVDLSPLACLISRVKVTPLERPTLDRLYTEMAEALAPLASQEGNQSSLLEGAPLWEDDPRLSDAWFTKWFQEQRLRELVHIKHQIDQVGDSRLQDVAMVAFSDILRRVSNAHSGYPNVMYDRREPRTPPAGPLFLRRLREITTAVGELPQALQAVASTRVIEGTAEALDLESGSIDAVVTHPPYIGSVPYAEYGALSLAWLGADPKALDHKLTGGRRQTRDVVDRFAAGFSGMVQECARVLRPDGYMFMLLGRPTVKGALIDLPAMAIDFAKGAGFELDSEFERKGVNRRANKMASEAGQFFRRL